MGESYLGGRKSRLLSHLERNENALTTLREPWPPVAGPPMPLLSLGAERTFWRSLSVPCP